MVNLINLPLMAAPGGESSPMGMFLPLILIFVVFYFFMIRPQMKRQKELTSYRNALQKGDKIVTTGGIYGKITDVKDNVVTVDVGNEVRLKIDKSAVLRDPSDLQQTNR